MIDTIKIVLEEQVSKKAMDVNEYRSDLKVGLGKQKKLLS
jgi:hypothetical protein